MSLSNEKAREVVANGGRVGFTIDGDLMEVGSGYTVDGDLERESLPGSGRSASGESLLCPKLMEVDLTALDIGF